MAMRHSSRRWTAPSLILLVTGAVVLGGAAVLPLPAASAAADPGAGTLADTTADTSTDTAQTRAAPRQLFREDFENGVGNGITMLDQYSGRGGERYIADSAWIDFDQCNGIIANSATPGLPCSGLASLYRALGQVNGTNPASNHGVAAWTADRRVPADGVQIRSAAPLRLPVSQRFVTFGVDAVAASCHEYAHPQLRFGLVDGTTERPVNISSIDPCGASSIGDGVRGGRFVSDAAVLFSGDSLGWVMRNAESGDAGNDGAIDGVTVYDATPALQHRFDGSTPYVGETARLTYTVQNTTENGAKPGWSFLEALPAGLTLAADPRAETTCSDGSVDAAPGGSAVAVTGSLRSGAASCTVSVDVTSETPGTYTLTAATVTDRVGLDQPGSTDVTFVAEDNALAVADRAVLDDRDDDGLGDVDEQLRFAQTVTNEGSRPLADLTVTGTNGPVTCEATTLDPGASTDCTTASRPIAQADVDRGGVEDRVTATATSPRGADVTAEAAAAQPTDRRAAIGTTLAARLPHGGVAPSPGIEVALSATVTNTGTTTLTDVTVAVDGRPELTVSCPAGPLAPGATADCTITGHPLTQDDIDAGSVAFASTATGTDPTGAPVTAQAADEVVLEQVATISTDISAHLAEAEHPVPHAGDGIEIALTVSNTGNVTLLDPGAAVDDRADLPVTCPAGALAPGATVACTLPGHELDQQDVEHGTVPFAETATANRLDGTAITARDTVVVGLGAASALFLEGEWTPSTEQLQVGDTIASRYRVTNTSNLVASTVALTSAGAGAITCEAVELVPGGSTSCVADEDRRVTAADAQRGRVDFVAVADGTVVRADSTSAEPSTPGQPVPVRSADVTATFPVAPVAAALAFTGADIAIGAVRALLLLALGVGLTLVRRRATR